MEDLKEGIQAKIVEYQKILDDTVTEETRMWYVGAIEALNEVLEMI